MVISVVKEALRAAPGPEQLKLSLAKSAYLAHLAVARRRRRACDTAELSVGPLMVSGFFNDAIGVGRGAVATANALQAAGLPIVRHDVRPVVSLSPLVHVDPPVGPGGVWIQHCNPPESDVLFDHISTQAAAGRYLIGYWAWELGVLPPTWRTAARAFHEIWAPSAFVADAIRPHAHRVRVMPHPLHASRPVAPDRARFGLPARAVVFAAFADARSSLARKNPLGAIQAYRRAFPKADGRAFLSVKLVAPEVDPGGVAELERAAAGRSDIRIWSEHLTNEAMTCYFASLDVVVSLHRSEGFGLTIAEGYLAGRPAIATAWSGNLDFVEPEVADALTPARLIPVADASGRYRGGVWADPDLDAAAGRMRAFAADPASLARAAGAAPRVEARFQRAWSPEVLAAQPWARYVQPSAEPQVAATAPLRTSGPLQEAVGGS